MTGGANSIGTTVQQAMSRPEAIWIVLSNAIPIAGVLFFGWPAFSLLLFYWIENVVVGAFNVLKIAVSGVTKPNPMAAFTGFLVPFFCFHYGLFCYVHGVFVLAMFSFGGGVDGAADEVATYVWRRLETDAELRLSVWMLIGVQAAWFVVLWVLAGKWRTTNPLVQNDGTLRTHSRDACDDLCGDHSGPSAGTGMDRGRGAGHPESLHGARPVAIFHRLRQA